ncbi:DedA family protein OS=Streptomyces tendae OX=1932 GN=GUR47_35285 PE=4 SV=1 [Streptomyces tendae]
MPLPTFLLLTGLGTLMWNTVLVMSGYWLGDQWDKVGDYVGVLSKVVLVAVVLALAFYIVVRLRSRGTAQHRRPS